MTPRMTSEKAQALKKLKEEQSKQKVGGVTRHFKVVEKKALESDGSDRDSNNLE